MAIELDHVFVQVNKGFPEKQNFAKHLPICNGRQHEGQGTAAEFLAFEKNYLEFIWLRDEVEASKNPLKLNKKFLANQCPFGVAYRGSLDENQIPNFWKYQPPYLSKGCLWIHKSHNSNMSLPMIFVVDLGVDNKTMWPSKKDRFTKEQILPGHFNTITINGPIFGEKPKLPNLVFKESEKYSMEISGVGYLNLDLLNVFATE